MLYKLYVHSQGAFTIIIFSDNCKMITKYPPLYTTSSKCLFVLQGLQGKQCLKLWGEKPVKSLYFLINHTDNDNGNNGNDYDDGNNQNHHDDKVVIIINEDARSHQNVVNVYTPFSILFNAWT